MRRTIPFLAAVLMSLSFAVPAAATAAPELAPVPGCAGSACEGRDPGLLCQEDARTVQTTRLGVSRLELRYSPVCGSVWSRFSGPWDHFTQIAPRAKVIRNHDGKSYACKFIRPGQHSCYTRMTNDIGRTAYAWGEWDTGYEVKRGRTRAF